MMTERTRQQLMDWAVKYNDPVYFSEDPIAFPREFVRRGASLQDIETAAIFAAHFAWGRRAMIVRDLERFFDFLEWKPLDYVLSGDYRSDDASIHRTIKWSETARICAALRSFYCSGEGSAVPPLTHPRVDTPVTGSVIASGQVRPAGSSHRCASLAVPPLTCPRVDMPAGGNALPDSGGLPSLELLTVKEIRVRIFGQKEDAKAPDKKINMMRRWMVRKDGKVDLGLWKGSDPADLLIPLDVHVYDEALALGLTGRRQKDIVTAQEITEALAQVFPGDPCLGDFALFGYGVSKNTTEKEE